MCRKSAQKWNNPWQLIRDKHFQEQELCQGSFSAVVRFACARRFPAVGAGPSAAGSRIFFGVGRAVTDRKKSDGLPCTAVSNPLAFSRARVNTLLFSCVVVCAVCCVLVFSCLGVPFQLSSLFVPIREEIRNTRTRCLPPWLRRRRRSRTWRGCWGPVRFHWRVIHCFKRTGLLTFCLVQAPPVLPSWLSSIPYVRRTTATPGTPMGHVVEAEEDEETDGIPDDRSIPLRSAS